MTTEEVNTMVVIYMLLLIAAAVCFGLAVAGVAPTTRRGSINLIALGLLFWVLVPLIQTLVRATS